MKSSINLGVIGLRRGHQLIDECLLQMDDVHIVAICDLKEVALQKTQNLIQERTGTTTYETKDYRDLLSMKQLDAVIIATTWDMHIPIALEMMEHGIYVGLEVGCAYNLEECWSLVHTAEKTGQRFMFLENCCYSRREMMALNMAAEGVFGDIVHCEGAYCHNLRESIVTRDYRLEDYRRRNCDNYPTHEVGPIAKLLDIHNGNRFLSLVSMASKARGMNCYASRKYGQDHPLADEPLTQGDIITTILKCAQGQTVTITLDTTLPCAYSRKFTVCGTKGRYIESNDSLFLEDEHSLADEHNWKPNWGNAAAYEKQYDHPLWAEHAKNEDVLAIGHNGTDWVSCRAFIETIKRDKPAPIDVYDATVMMAISVLSEQSIAMGGAPVMIPDFTRGKWLNKTQEIWEYGLRGVYRG